MKSKKFKNGFTFIEFLISLGIFAMVVIIVLGVYTNVTKVVVENHAQIELNQDGQIILNSIIEDIRKCEVAYKLYDPPIPAASKVVNSLLLKETSDATTTVNYIAYRLCPFDNQKNIIQKCYKPNDECELNESCQAEKDFKTLTAPTINVDRLDFHINPNFNPFVVAALNKAHPKITTVIKLRSTRSTKKPHELILQQTDYQKSDY